MTKVEYVVKNLDCAGCAGKIQGRAGEYKGVINANLDIYKKKFILETDESFDEESFYKEISKYADSVEPGTEFVRENRNKTRVEYDVKNLDCAGCAGKIQGRAGEYKGVINANLDIYKKKFILETDESFDEESFYKEISKYADSVEPGTKFARVSEYNEEEEILRKQEEKYAEELHEKREKLSILLGVLFFVGTILTKSSNPTLSIVLAVVAYLILGWEVIFKSVKNMTKGNFMDENFLMTIATLGAFYLRETTEAVGVMLFYKIGEYFQDKAVSNSRRSIEKLLDIRPEYANIRDEKGEIITISPKKLKKGDIIIVKAGEKIPVDSIIVKGKSSLNTSALTGESLPQDVEVGDEVLSGSINGNGVLELEVTKIFGDSTINKIIQMVEESSNKKAKSEKFITKFARYYTPIVVILAFLVGVVVPLIFGNFEMWFGRALIFLVISCPCALVISVPLTFFSSIGVASKEGILIKGGNYLEALTDIQVVIFDKTGTLTKGKFKVDHLESVNGDEKELIKFAKIGETYSNHPIAKAILRYGDVEIAEEYIEGYKEIGGFGTVSYYEGEEILVGNYKLMQDYNIQAVEKDYVGTVIYIAKNSEFLGYIFISDEVKEDSAKTIKMLTDMDIETYMLTGDSKKIGEVVGQNLGIKLENIFTHLLPQNKVEVLKKIMGGGKKTVFVGDGINDAPVLAISDIGVSMGGLGSDLAVETSDVVIMQDEPSKIVEALKIAKINKKIVIQNIVFALGIKIIVMILGVLGYTNIWMAIFSDVGVSLIAILNASWGVKRANR